MNAKKRLSTLYIPHGGGPCFFMDPPADDPHRWDGLAQKGRDPATRDEQLKGWRAAPGGRAAHPREEHPIPLMVAAGAADGDTGYRSFGDSLAGNAVSGFQFG